MLEPFAEVAGSVSFSRPGIPVVSNLTGCAAAGEELCSADYWVRHVRETVRFADGVRWLGQQGVRSFLELGPDGVLSAMVQECLGESHIAQGAETGDRRADGNHDDGLAGTRADLIAMPLLRAGRPEVKTLLTGFAGACIAGADVDWAPLLRGRGEYVELPTYAFQRERFWLNALGIGGVDAEALGQSSAAHPLLGATVALADEQGWLFTGRLSLQTDPWLADHLVLGRVLLPGTAFLEFALYACAQLGGGVVRELTLQSPLALPEHGAVQLQVKVGQADDAGVRPLSIHSRTELEIPQDAPASAAEWVCHALGSLAPAQSGAQRSQVGLESPASGVCGLRSTPSR